MYNEEHDNRNYFFRNLIVKILLVLLFVFLLMWLFPMPNLSPFYDKIFKENVDTMTEAARNYYTTARLPQKENETKTLTLQEMLSNKMVLAINDSNGKACNANKSYVEVTKKDGEYQFKTFLSCDTEEDYVITYVGCTDICANGSCDVTEDVKKEKIIEYQFYKITKEKVIDKYVCKTGYTLSGNKCISTTEIEEQEEVKLSCPTGYTYDSEIKKCEKLVIEKIDAEKVCPAGYTYSSSLDKCTKGTTVTEDAKYTYKCADNSIPVNGQCPLTIRTEVAAKKAYACPTGYTLSTDKSTCTLTKDSKIIYACSTGVTPVGNQCPKYSTVTNPGTCKEEKICSYKVYSTKVANVTRTSSNNYSLTYQKPVTGGYLYLACHYIMSSCTPSSSYTTVSYTPADVYYACPEGVKSEDNTKCILSVDPTITYSCDAGTLNGDVCILSSTTNRDAIKVYSCTNGTLNGDKCYISSTETTDYSLYCKIGTLCGSKCLITTFDRKTPTYACKSGYTLIGNTCYKFSSETKIEEATITYKTTSTKVYKWSRSKTLEGWTRTGKTRTVEVIVK